MGISKDWYKLVGNRWTKDGIRLLLLRIPRQELIDLVQPGELEAGDVHSRAGGGREEGEAHEAFHVLALHQVLRPPKS